MENSIQKQNRLVKFQSVDKGFFSQIIYSNDHTSTTIQWIKDARFWNVKYYINVFSVTS